MKTLYAILSTLFFGLALSFGAAAQNEWPKTINSGGQAIKVYQWQPESFLNGSLRASAAISVTENGKEPVFGMIWLTADADDDGQQVVIHSVEATDIKLPNVSDANVLADLQTVIAKGMSGWNLSIPSDEINNNLQVKQEEAKLSDNFNNNPPQIIYADKPSLLVLIDGTPKLQKNDQLGAEVVINTPFTIIKDNGKFYLYGGKHWYLASSATGPYALTTNIPGNLEKIQSEIAQANKDSNAQQEDKDYVISNIIVSTEPAELLQSDGEPNFTPIQSTNLLYVRNSDNDIFMDVASQQYFVLLSGRWYKSAALSGKWNYVASDKLPADFAKIPEGSPKDNVLASVGGTIAAKDAVMDAQVPQTAKVDRSKAAADIQYDGDPQFNDIEGTDMAYAINTPDYVIRWRGSYYAVDNGVWFQSYNPNGPWTVSIDRPDVVSLIPPRYPVYAMKYVYIYDVTPDFVYTGYSRGYLNAFVYGPTVVYGTGYYYRPWYGSHYYARPYTWGFNMHYRPWAGWGFGFDFNIGWFNVGIGSYAPRGGWWGPQVYRPSYYRTPYYGASQRGYYGAHGNRGGNTVIVNNINVYRNNNIYHYRNDVVTRDNRRPASTNRNIPARVGGTRVADRNLNRSGANPSRPSVGRTNAPGNISSGNLPRRAPTAINGRTNTPVSRPANSRPSNNNRITVPQRSPSEVNNNLPARRPANANPTLPTVSSRERLNAQQPAILPERTTTDDPGQSSHDQGSAIRSIQRTAERPSPPAPSASQRIQAPRAPERVPAPRVPERIQQRSSSSAPPVRSMREHNVSPRPSSGARPERR